MGGRVPLGAMRKKAMPTTAVNCAVAVHTTLRCSGLKTPVLSPDSAIRYSSPQSRNTPSASDQLAGCRSLIKIGQARNRRRDQSKGIIWTPEPNERMQLPGPASWLSRIQRQNEPARQLILPTLTITAVALIQATASESRSSGLEAISNPGIEANQRRARRREGRRGEPAGSSNAPPGGTAETGAVFSFVRMPKSASS